MNFQYNRFKWVNTYFYHPSRPPKLPSSTQFIPCFFNSVDEYLYMVRQFVLDLAVKEGLVENQKCTPEFIAHLETLLQSEFVDDQFLAFIKKEAKINRYKTDEGCLLSDQMRNLMKREVQYWWLDPVNMKDDALIVFHSRKIFNDLLEDKDVGLFALLCRHLHFSFGVN